MKILFITNMYPTAENSVFGIFVKEQIDDIVKALQVEWEVYFINARYEGKLKYLRSIFEIPLKIWRGKFDIVHIHYGLSALFLLFFRPKAKIFLTLHGADILIKQERRIQVWITKRILRKVDKVYILNPEMEAIVKPLNSNYEILPCGVNTDFFKPNGFKTNKEQSRKVVFTSNPQEKVKNFPLFQEVIQLLDKQSGKKIEYKCIHQLSRAGVRDLLNSADCLLMTSISEGSPQVIKEALSCGLPIVSVPVGDVPSMTQDIPHCYVSNSYSPEELSDLVALSFRRENGDTEVIRETFINKGIYDHVSVTRRLIENYRKALSI